MLRRAREAPPQLSRAQQQLILQGPVRYLLWIAARDRFKQGMFAPGGTGYLRGSVVSVRNASVLGTSRSWRGGAWQSNRSLVAESTPSRAQLIGHAHTGRVRAAIPTPVGSMNPTSRLRQAVGPRICRRFQAVSRKRGRASLPGAGRLRATRPSPRRRPAGDPGAASSSHSRDSGRQCHYG